MVEKFRKTTSVPKRYFQKPYKSPLRFQKGEYIVKESPQKKKPDSDTLALLQKLRKREQEEANSKKNKKRKR